MKNVLFIIPPYIADKERYAQRSFVTMPQGVLSIASYIKDVAHSTVFDCNLYGADYECGIKRLLIGHSFDVIGISLMFDISYRYIPGILNIAKGHGEIVVGGAAATPNYQQILDEQPDIVAVCYGEGECAVREYLKSGTFGPGWATRGIEPERNVVTDLDACIDIDYSIIDIETYQESIEESYSPYMHGRDGKRQFIIITSRGCPYSCTFCMNSLNPDKTVRYASVDAIIAQVERLIDRYGMNVLTFYDDQILHNHDRALELFTRLKPYGLRIEMPNGVNVAGLDEPIVKAMKEAGVDTIYLALESGSPEMLKVMRKPVNLDRAREVVNLLRKYDFFIFVFLVIGLPEETDAHRRETIQYIREIKPDLINPKPASPVYGSALRRQCIEAGYIQDRPFGDYEMMDSVIRTETNDPEDIHAQAMAMNYRTNFVENYRMSIGDYKTAKHYFGYVASKYPHEIFAHYHYAKALYMENINNARGKFNSFDLRMDG